VEGRGVLPVGGPWQLVLGQQRGRAGTPGAPLVHPPAVSAFAYISSICVR